MKGMCLKMVCLTFSALLFSCNDADRNLLKREIIYFVEPSDSNVTEDAKTMGEVVNENSQEQTIETTKESIEKNFSFVKGSLKDKGIRVPDVAEIETEYELIEEALQSGNYNGLLKRIDDLSALIDSVKIDEEFVISKKIILEDAVTRIQPRGDFLKSITEGMASSEELIKEKNFVEANKVLNEIFLMLGE